MAILMTITKFSMSENCNFLGALNGRATKAKNEYPNEQMAIMQAQANVLGWFTRKNIESC